MKVEDLLVRSLTRLRDSRLVWDAMGSLYNRRIRAALAGLLDHVADREAADDDLMSFMRRFGLGFLPDRLFFWGLRNVVFGQSFTEESLADALRRAGFGRLERSREPSCPYVVVRAVK